MNIQNPDKIFTLSNFHSLVICSLFKINLSASNGLNPDQDRQNPDLGPNCLQRYPQMTKVAASKGRFSCLNQYVEAVSLSRPQNNEFRNNQ